MTQQGRHRDIAIRSLTAASRWIAEDITNGGTIAVEKFGDALLWGTTGLVMGDTVTYKSLGPL